MSITTKILAAATATGPGSAVAIDPKMSNRSFVISVAGTGAVSCAVNVEVSNDGGTVWATRMTFASLSGTTLATDTDVDPSSPYPLIRANVTALAGTGAAVTVSVSAS